MFSFQRWSQRAAVALAIFCAPASYAAPALTTIQDVIYKADGTRFNGSLLITWSSFQAGDTTPIGVQALTVPVVNGVIKVRLVPTTNASAGANYSVQYSSQGKYQFSEMWAVPPSSTPLHILDVRVGTGTVVGPPPVTTSIQISDVTGLTNELNVRPMEGTAFTPSRAAVINTAGQIDAAAGNLGDCVHVDGTSGPCGSASGTGASPNFADSETPAGLVDGSNTVYTLSYTPSPSASLALFRNGMLMKQGVDYTISGATITFYVASDPQPGDLLTANYRYSTAIGSSRHMIAASHISTPQVICSGMGDNTNSAILTQLGECAIAADSLASGNRFEIQFDYSHEGACDPFSIQVRWGESTIASRAGDASESFVSGKATVAVHSDGAQWSVQSLTDHSASIIGVGNAPDNVSDGVTVRFLGQVAGNADSVALRSFTVIRYPAQ